MDNTILCLMGPTATGKTELALLLSEKFPVEIVSVDSAMVYCDLNIGTAKPSLDILRRIPHHLINIRKIDEHYSVSQFCKDALHASEAIINRKKIPLFVGGTFLYFKAFQQGLSLLPPANIAIRKQLLDEAQTLGWQALHQRLETLDPKAAERIHPNDPQRIQRALEVYYTSGKPMTEHWQAGVVAKPPYCFINLALFPEDRALLHEKIALRLEHMWDQGFVNEVGALQAKGYSLTNTPALRTIGYRQILKALEEKWPDPKMKEQVLIATRQLAKRQMTWLRHWENAIYFDPYTKTILQDIQRFLKKSALQKTLRFTA